MQREKMLYHETTQMLIYIQHNINMWANGFHIKHRKKNKLLLRFLRSLLRMQKQTRTVSSHFYGYVPNALFFILFFLRCDVCMCRVFSRRLIQQCLNMKMEPLVSFRYQSVLVIFMSHVSAFLDCKSRMTFRWVR